MAYFDCQIVQDGGGAITLIVTCDPVFAGLTISATDGETTLTETCPSSSPYTIEFKIPNMGEWTVSATYSGHTFSESILIADYEIELSACTEVTVDLYSAANDTVTFTDLNGAQTVVTDSSGKAENVPIKVYTDSPNITFTSSVAKDAPNADGSTYYSKTIVIKDDMDEIFVMPDGLVLYWYGYKKGDFNGYAYMASGDWGAVTPSVTKGTNGISMSVVSNGGNRAAILANPSQQIDASKYTSMKAFFSTITMNGSDSGYNTNMAMVLAKAVQNNYSFWKSETKLSNQVKTNYLSTLDISTVSNYGYYLIRATNFRYQGDCVFNMSAAWVE